MGKQSNLEKIGFERRNEYELLRNDYTKENKYDTIGNYQVKDYKERPHEYADDLEEEELDDYYKTIEKQALTAFNLYTDYLDQAYNRNNGCPDDYEINANGIYIKNKYKKNSRNARKNNHRFF